MNNWIAILSSLFIALILTLLPMPEWTLWLRPAWVLLILIYWTIAMPHRVGMGVAWIAGLIMDLLNGTLLGEHALAYTVVIYFISSMSIRIRMYPILQQSLSVLFFCLVYQFILYCIQGFIGKLPVSHLYWLSSFTSMLLWPWLSMLLRDCQYRFKLT